jgi:ribosome-binding factor A
MKSKKTNTYRPLRVASLIRTALDEVLLLGKHLDPRLQDSKCNITQLEISSDLKLVTCHFIPCITSKISADDLLKLLNESKFAIRKMITSKVKLKYSPEIRFIYDHSFENAIKVNKALNVEEQFMGR